METWTPLQVFIAAYVASALSGLAGLLWSAKPLTVRSACASVLYYGAAGTGLGMLGYEYLGGKEKPWRVIGCAMLVGIGVVDLATLQRLATRLLGTDKGVDKSGTRDTP